MVCCLYDQERFVEALRASGYQAALDLIYAEGFANFPDPVHRSKVVVSAVRKFRDATVLPKTFSALTHQSVILPHLCVLAMSSHCSAPPCRGYCRRQPRAVGAARWRPTDASESKSAKLS